LEGGQQEKSKSLRVKLPSSSKDSSRSDLKQKIVEETLNLNTL
jgi:hypothetical protein